MKNREVNLITSESWMDESCDKEEILQETINEFVSEYDRIINIEIYKSNSGISKFYIFTETEVKK